MTKTCGTTKRKLVQRKVADLVPYAKNSRTHSDAQVAQIASSIREFGWTNPILVDEAGGIIAGHGRLLAAKSLGEKSVPCIVLEGLSDQQKRALVIADNKLALNAGWDEALLSSELQGLLDEGFDLDLLGFAEDELAALFADDVLDEPVPDEVPPPPVDPVTMRGDVWLLGNHRVMCGDCRDADDVAKVVAGNRINLAFTSPPYAEQRDYDPSSGFRPIPPDEFVEWFAPVAAGVSRHLADDGSWFVNIKPSCSGLDTSLYVFDLVIAHVREWGWHFATEFCWERNGVPKGVTQRFKNQFEPIYQFVHNRWKMRPDAVRHESPNVPRAGGKGSGNTTWKNKQGGDGAHSVSGSFGGAKKRRNGTSEFMADVQGQNTAPDEYIGPGLAYPGNRLPTFNESHDATGHTAAFPVGLPEFFCKAYTDKGDTVFDPFLGSGSTLIAAHKIGRHGLGIELSPAYVDVAVIRWQEFTGEEATLEATGQTFAEVAEERAKVAEAA